jgi:hypothetical protein
VYGIQHHVYGTELKKNLMERFIQQQKIKDRTIECFDDHYFPCRKPDCDRQHHVWNWLKLFVLYLHMRRTDRIRFMTFLIEG